MRKQKLRWGTGQKEGGFLGTTSMCLIWVSWSAEINHHIFPTGILLGQNTSSVYPKQSFLSAAQAAPKKMTGVVPAAGAPLVRLRSKTSSDSLGSPASDVTATPPQQVRPSSSPSPTGSFLDETFDCILVLSVCILNMWGCPMMEVPPILWFHYFMK